MTEDNYPPAGVILKIDYTRNDEGWGFFQRFIYRRLADNKVPGYKKWDFYGFRAVAD